MYSINQAPGRTVFTKNKEYLFFSGYSYLGMSHVPEFTELVINGINKYGLIYPSSRISNTQLALYTVFEKILSKLLVTEDTISFSSGYMAGRAIVELVTNNYRHIFSAPNTHPAIACGEKLTGSDWKNQLVKTINQSSAESFVLFMDAVNPLNATVVNFSFLHEINANKKLTCIIDDSHGMGLLGPFAQGISHLVPRIDNIDYVFTYSLSKAFHINAGAVSCSKKMGHQLRDTPFYAASTPVMPAMVYAFIEGQPIYLRQLQKLQQNIEDFINAIGDIGFINYYPHLPIFILNKQWDQKVFDPHHIIISSFAYPNTSSNKVNRVVLNALHTKQDLFKLSCVINQLHQESL